MKLLSKFSGEFRFVFEFFVVLIFYQQDLFHFSKLFEYQQTFFFKFYFFSDEYRIYLESKERSENGIRGSEFASKLFDNKLPQRFLIEEENVSSHNYELV